MSARFPLLQQVTERTLLKRRKVQYLAQIQSPWSLKTVTRQPIVEAGHETVQRKLISSWSGRKKRKNGNNPILLTSKATQVPKDLLQIPPPKGSIVSQKCKARD